MPAHLVAHAGGFSWDEALFVLTPVVILVLLLRAARKRAELEEQREAGEGVGMIDPPPDDS